MEGWMTLARTNPETFRGEPNQQQRTTANSNTHTKTKQTKTVTNNNHSTRFSTNNNKQTSKQTTNNSVVRIRRTMMMTTTMIMSTITQRSSSYHGVTTTTTITTPTRMRLLVFLLLLLLARLVATNATTNTNANATTNTTTDFPLYRDTVEFAALSTLVYALRHSAGNVPKSNASSSSSSSSSSVCLEWRTIAMNHNLSQWIAPDAICHWYHHEPHTSTQVWLVSSHQHNYVAVVFAGTDDWKTSFTDLELITTPFGSHDGENDNNNNNDDDDDENHEKNQTSSFSARYLNHSQTIRVHDGFDRAVFGHGVYDNLSTRVQALFAAQQQASLSNPSSSLITRLITTGHSLGGANAILTAIALDVQWSSATLHSSTAPFTRQSPTTTTTTTTPSCTAISIMSLTFGCPQIGNSHFRDFVQSRLSLQRRRQKASSRPVSPRSLSLWRVVLGWDLVPRLPEYLYHVGHTIQINVNQTTTMTSTTTGSTSTSTSTTTSTLAKRRMPTTEMTPITTTSTFHHNNASGYTTTAQVYYQHYGNATLHYASVPLGWNAKSFVWIPGALESHRMRLYTTVLRDWWHHCYHHDQQPLSSSTSSTTRDHDTNHSIWIDSFVTESDEPPSNLPNNDDDDRWINPPDDEFEAEAWTVAAE